MCRATRARSYTEDHHPQAWHAPEMRFVSRPDEDAVFEFEGCRRDDVIGGNQLATPTELSVKIRPSFRCTKSKINDGRKPCGLLNVAGYYDGLLSFMQRSVEDDLMSAETLALVIVDDDPARLVERVVEATRAESSAA